MGNVLIFGFVIHMVLWIMIQQSSSMQPTLMRLDRCRNGLYYTLVSLLLTSLILGAKRRRDAFVLLGIEVLRSSQGRNPKHAVSDRNIVFTKATIGPCKKRKESNKHPKKGHKSHQTNNITCKVSPSVKQLQSPQKVPFDHKEPKAIYIDSLGLSYPEFTRLWNWKRI